ILQKKYKLAWSYILEYENHFNPFDYRKNIILQWKSIADCYIEESVEIIKEAEKIQKLNIKTKDALHLACAKKHNIDCFITTDNKLVKTEIEGVKILNPVEFIRNMEEK
ncbi:MAG: PIN domain-containing protein, partial [Candidatus Muiribacteriota bacterium]